MKFGMGMRLQSGRVRVAPVNSVAPSVTGTAVVGETLSCSSGIWVPSVGTTYAYQWQRDGVNIGGATSATYLLVEADAETSVRCRVTATADGLSTLANSNAVDVEAVNPFPDHAYKFSHVLPAETFPSAQTAFPVPFRATIPELATALESSVYIPEEVLNLPLTGHTTDLSFGTAKAAPQTAQAIDHAGGTQEADHRSYSGGVYDNVQWATDGTFGEGDWYIRCHGRIDAKSGQQTFIGMGVESTARRSIQLEYYVGAGLRAYGYQSGASEWFNMSEGSDATWEVNTWYLLELYRSGNNVYLRRNGLQVATDTVSGAAPECPTMALGAVPWNNTYDNLLAGDIKDVLILKGTSTAPAATYQYALQDFRVAIGGVEAAVSYPLRGRDPISGIVDGWVRSNWLSSADNTLTAYIGNDAAEAPTTGCTFPEDWPADPTSATWPDDWAEAELTAGQDTILDRLIDTPDDYNESATELTPNV